MSNQEPATILLIDDHPMLRTGVKQLISMAPDITVVGEASNGEQGIELAESLDPDLILLDLNMPGMNGLETLDKLREKSLSGRIVVFSVSNHEEDVVTVTDEESGALTPEGNLTLVDDYHTSYSDGSGQQFITLVSKSGNTFYLVIDRNDKGENTVHFMNLVDEADLLSLMEDEDADAYTAEKETAAQAEQERKQAEEDAKKAAEEAEASGSEQTGGNKVTKYAATFLGVLALVGLVAGGGIYTFMKQKQKKQAEKEALDPDANYTEDKGDFEIPVEDEPEETGEEDNAEE